jgi:hypothetical protein
MEMQTAGKWVIAYLFSFAKGNIATDVLDRLMERYGEDFYSLENIINEWVEKGKPQNRIKDLIVKIANESDCSYFSTEMKKINLESMWILINIACRINDISENQTSIIQSLKEDWKINDAAILEMQDTAETMAAIDEYNTKYCSLPNMNKKKRSVNEMNLLVENIECLIGELSNNYETNADNDSNQNIWEGALKPL